MTVSEPARSQHAQQRAQGILGLAQVLEHEAHEHVIETGVGKGQGKEVCLLELHVAKPFAFDRLARQCQRLCGHVHADKVRPRTSPREDARLRPDPASGLEHPAALGIVSIVVKQIRQGARLIRQTSGLVFGVAVDIVERRHGLGM